MSAFLGLFSSSSNKESESAKPDSSERKARRNSMDRNLSCDEMDSDDLDGDLNLSDDESGAATRNQIKKKSAPEARLDREKYAIEFDTNVFKVALDCLENKTALVAGDAEFCTDCKGVFNRSSTLVEEEGKQIWVCEFCNKRNEVMIGEEEIPQHDEVTYIIEAAAQVE